MKLQGEIPMDKNSTIETFDENGVHFLEHKKPKVKTQISIDFVNGQVKIYVITPKTKKLEDDETKEGNTLKLVETNSRHLIINKHFKVSYDLKTVYTNNTFYDIPCFYNKEMLKIYDEKTWSMIFYQIFSNEVLSALAKFKNLSKKRESPTD